ncbi:MAG: hypothetical protein A3H72_02825 [Candidatus Doudnabacteria bacterium RIFCSPLOWO2_02_FULL_48_8]|uniref:Uncharacterized protein n=1 Tax=Candidatus Doudnabacteria bacterium RIFCSPHIGHO2_01_FULL_46_24 TaxID=1817825 RepID=A0A1F5NVS6_9BACT|nr:MAG: hypothetical protein A2720_00130 [Candidatus Doudnabacteria bacterium RIFCSPHIGHO2_01_FULL_46_24]OGE94920.1 MAG: hypothetical protein A3H72_02825 [Candidatus Doudnabacteria bacterium RIFCSPLOWO2_02_FULL_48_8]OGE95506.1 MAG: hypothetical protein A3E98_01510 [Candidatus Doudnabacteria bacterium RIFCSPHIGHO2_12_FULL_48_11]
MSEFEKQKFSLMAELKTLCAHCRNEVAHNCRIQTIADQINQLRGVPLIVNDRFNGLLILK